MNRLCQQVMDDLLKQIDAGVSPWRASWKTGMPMNVTTRRNYRGINVLILWLAAQEKGFRTNEWASAKQFGAAGYRVRAEEMKNSERILFFKKLPMKDADGKVQMTRDGRAREFGMLRVAWVFNVGQLEQWDYGEASEHAPEDRHLEAQTILDRLPILWVNGQPAYSPIFDSVAMPPADVFDSLDHYYSAKFHEVVHWTGHGSRLARDGICKPIVRGSPAYAAEELVAEIGSAFLNARIGINTGESSDSAASYLAGWLKHFPNRAEALYAAAKDAHAAMDFIVAGQAQQEAA